MKKFEWVLLLAFVVATTATRAQVAGNQTWPPVINMADKPVSMPSLSGNQLRVCTYSLLAEKKLPPVEYAQWKTRIKTVAHIFKDCHPDFIGTQDALEWQVSQLETATGYARTGTTASGTGDDSLAVSNAIFYNAARFKLTKEGHFWYSDTPSRAGSKIPHTHAADYCNWACFKDKESGEKIYIFNTSLYDRADNIRGKQAAILLEQIKKIAGGKTVVLTCNLKSQPNKQASVTLKRSEMLNDASLIAERKSGCYGTYHAFRITKPSQRFDYIFTSKGIIVNGYDVIDEEFQTERPGSDHLPVTADITLP